MKKLRTIFIFFLLIPTLLFSQTTGQGGIMNSDQNFISPGNGIANIGGTSVPTDKNLYEGVKGRPMIFKEFVKGFVFTKDTVNSLENYTYNFDAFRHELHIRYPNGKIKIPYNNQIIGFQLLENGKAHNFKKIKVAGENDRKFYEIIAETPQYSLVKLWGRNFVRANPVERGLYQTGRRHDEFQEIEIFFFKVNERAYVELKKLSKSNFIELLPNQKNSIENYWSSHKLGKKINEEEATKLLKALEK